MGYTGSWTSKSVAVVLVKVLFRSRYIRNNKGYHLSKNMDNSKKHHLAEILEAVDRHFRIRRQFRVVHRRTQAALVVDATVLCARFGRLKNGYHRVAHRLVPFPIISWYRKSPLEYFTFTISRQAYLCGSSIFGPNRVNVGLDRFVLRGANKSLS